MEGCQLETSSSEQRLVVTQELKFGFHETWVNS